MFLSFRKVVKTFKDFFFFCDDFYSLVYHFNCGENLLVALKHVDLIISLAGANLKVKNVVFCCFLNTISAPCLIFLMRTLSCFMLLKGWRLSKHPSILSYFLSFSTDDVTSFLGVIALYSGVVSISSTSRRVPTVLMFLLSVKILLASETDDCGIVVRFIGTWGNYLLVS